MELIDIYEKLRAEFFDRFDRQEKQIESLQLQVTQLSTLCSATVPNFALAKINNDNFCANYAQMTHSPEAAAALYNRGLPPVGSV